MVDAQKILLDMFNGQSVPHDLSVLYPAGFGVKTDWLQNLGVYFFNQSKQEFMKGFSKDLQRIDYYLDTYGIIPKPLKGAYESLLSEMNFFATDVWSAVYLGYWTQHPDPFVSKHLITLSLEDGRLVLRNSSLCQYLLEKAFYDGKLEEVVRELRVLGFEHLPENEEDFETEELSADFPNPMAAIHKCLDEYEKDKSKK